MPFAPEPFTIGRTAAARRIAASPAAVDASVPLGIIAIGGLIAWLCQNFPASLPVWAPWDFSWPEFLAAALGAWWYRARRGADSGNGAAERSPAACRSPLA